MRPLAGSRQPVLTGSRQPEGMRRHEAASLPQNHKPVMNKKVALGLLAAGLLAGSLPAQTVNTVVANQPNGLLEPYSLAVDSDNNLFIADSANHRIAKYNSQSGQLTTFAGKMGEFGTNNGALLQARFFDPKTVLLVSAGLVVADSGNNALRLINLTNGTVSTLAGVAARTGGYADGPAATALFRGPRGLAADTNGNIYISDMRNKAVRKLDTNNVVSTVATNFAGPAGLAMGDNGLWVADQFDHTLKFITNGTTTAVVRAGISGNGGFLDAENGREALFNLPDGVLWLGANFGLLVSESDNHTLRRVYSTNLTSTNYVVQSYAGAAGAPGDENGDLATARFNKPAGLAKYLTGFLVVDELNNAIRQILISPQPPRISDPVLGRIIVVVDQDTGNSQTKLIPFADNEIFNEDIVIGALAEKGISTLFTFGASRTDITQPDPIADPNTSLNSAPDYQDGLPPSQMPPSMVGPLPDLTIKAISKALEGEGRASSQIVTNHLHFVVARPTIDAANPGNIVLKNITAGATLWFTTDGSDPTDGPTQNPATQGPKFHGEKLSFILGTTNLTLKVKAFRSNFKPSQIASVELSPTNFTPNRISFGFAGGEASSDFVAAAGQRFYAPVTLSLLGGQKMYSLQFNVTLDNGTGPASTNYLMSFQSMLMEQLPDKSFRTIPPMAFVRTDLITITNIGSDFTNVFTNAVLVFTNLVFINDTEGLMGVGWLERVGQAALFDTAGQDLITYSRAHDTTFLSANGKVLVGIFSFIIPINAAPGDTYQIQIGRPSATEDGISADVFIESPDGSDPNVAIRGKKTVTVGEPRFVRYVVGDVAPFGWFNAGDFGDTNILNNDLIQMLQSISYTNNLPPPGSDFFDAMDTCCFGATTNGLKGTNWSGAFNPSDGSDANINQIAFGDGVLDINDLYVTFRRSLDPDLKWYARYWSNGVRQATIVSNLFRGNPLRAAATLSMRQADSASPIHALGAPALQPFVTVAADTVRSLPGQTVRIPLRGKISGNYPLRTLLLSVHVVPIDGSAPLSEPIRFQVASGLGAHSLSGSRYPGNYSAAWLDTSQPGILGDELIGTLEVSIPTTATANAAYRVHFEHVSASPNGVGIFPRQTIDGAITMSNRTAMVWQDGIPDQWRMTHFNSLVNLLSHAAADADGDGMSNLAEFKAGTSPTDIASRLHMLADQMPQNEGGAERHVVLSWPTVRDKVYLLEGAASLDAPNWTIISSSIVGTGAEMKYADPDPSQRFQFYRVRLAE